MNFAQPGVQDARPMDSRRPWRRQQLLDAAIRVMQRTGYHQMSMQALANEAGVSVGLAYRYFRSKEDVLLDAILDILDALRAELPPAAASSGAAAPERLRAMFGAYIRVIDRYRAAVLLTYRESATLPSAGRTQLKELEVATAAPLAAAIRDGITDGDFISCDVELVVHDLVLIAHGWALKHWLFAREHTVEDYIERQCDLMLRALTASGTDNPRRRTDPTRTSSTNKVNNERASI
jgi:AcrR family transcriptional regulator